MPIGGIRIKENIGRRPPLPRTASLCFVVWLSVFRNLHRRRPSVRAKGPDEECKRGARSRPCRPANAKSVEQRYITDSAGSKPAVWCFVTLAGPPQKSSAQPQIGRTAGLEAVRLDAYIGEMIRSSPMRNIGTANIKTHLSLSTENLQYYGVVTSAVFNAQAIVL